MSETPSIYCRKVGGALPPPPPTPLDLRDNSCNTGGLQDRSHHQLGVIEKRGLVKNLRSWEFINLYVRRTTDVLVATLSGHWIGVTEQKKFPS